MLYVAWSSYSVCLVQYKVVESLSPVNALQFFYRDASSALLQLVNQ